MLAYETDRLSSARARVLAEQVELKLARVGKDAARMKIDQLIEEDVLHLFDPEVVLQVAMTFGFIVTVCCVEPHEARANGVWIATDGVNHAALSAYRNKSHGLCSRCASKHFPPRGEKRAQEAAASADVVLLNS